MFEDGYLDLHDQEYNVYVIADGAKYIKHNDKIYVLMANRTPYKLLLENRQKTNCFAVIYIDGIRMGGWSIPAYSTVTVYRSTWLRKRFYLIAQPTSFNKDWRLEDYAKTVVQVDFYPEHLTASQNRMPTTCHERSFNKYYKGNIELSGYDEKTSRLVTLDYNKKENDKKTVILNLLVDTRFHKPYLTTAEYDYHLKSDTEITKKEIDEIPDIRILEDFYVLPRILRFTSAAGYNRLGLGI